MIVWLVAIASWALGWVLVHSGVLGLNPSYTGVMIFVALALLIRNRRLRLSGVEEGSPERALWVFFATRTVMAAFMLHQLLAIGPNFVMHTPQIHAFGISTWTLVAGAVLASWLARDPDPRRDERDLAIAHRGLNAGYWALCILLLVLIFNLGFGFSVWLKGATHAAIAHVLIFILIASNLADLACRLLSYRQDHAHAVADAEQ